MSILSEAQRTIWVSLAGAVQHGFVLYGGTAVALRFGHRVSVDFDFFTDHALIRTALDECFAFLAKAVVLQDERDSLTALVSFPQEEVKLSFFGDTNFGRVGEPQFTEDRVMQVASAEDLMATKLKVILERSESKDYLDIASLLRAGQDLAAGLAAARVLFGAACQPSESLKALTYFEDGDLRTLSPDIRAELVAATSRGRALPVVGICSRPLAADA